LHDLLGELSLSGVAGMSAVHWDGFNVLVTAVVNPFVWKEGTRS
jgi:hypothetical protein